MNLSRIFKQLNLTPLHAKIYEAVLTGGKMSILELAKSTKIPRSSCYEYLPDLVERGLISMNKKYKSTNLQVENPRRLLSLMELKAKEITYEYEYLQSNQNELLMEFAKTQGQETMQILKGLSVLEPLFTNWFKKQLELYFFSSGTVDKIAGLSFYTDYFDLLRILSTNKIHTKEILEVNNFSLVYRNQYYSDLQQIQLFTPQQQINDNRVDKFIIGENILLIKVIEEEIVLINNELLANFEKQNLLLLWNLLLNSKKDL